MLVHTPPTGFVSNRYTVTVPPGLAAIRLLLNVYGSVRHMHASTEDRALECLARLQS